MPFLETLTDWVNQLTAENRTSESTFMSQLKARKLERIMARAAARAARAAQAQADFISKAKYNAAMETIVEQAKLANANAMSSQAIQHILAVLLILNFLALIGVIIVNTPALKDQRDKYVTPVIESMIRGVEEVKAASDYADEIFARAVLYVMEVVLDVRGVIVEKYGDVKARVVVALNGQEKVAVKNQGGMIPQHIGRRAPVSKGSNWHDDSDYDSEPEALDENDGPNVEHDATSEHAPLNYTPSESESEDEQEVLDVQDYIDAADADPEADSDSEAEEEAEVPVAVGEDLKEWDLCDTN